MTSPTLRPLRVGLLLDTFTVPSWVARVLKEVTQAGVAEFRLIILNTTEVTAHKSFDETNLITRALTYYRKRHFLPFAVYQKLDSRRYQPTIDPFDPVDISPLVLPCPILRVVPRKTKFSDYFEDEVLREIMAHDLDVALRFGFRILKGSVLSIGRFGVWSFHHGDNLVNRGGPAGFWEVFHRHPTTGAILQQLTDELDAGLVLGRSRSKTNFSSPTANRANYFWQAGALLLRELRRVQQEGEARIREAGQSGWSAYSAPLYTAPTPIQTARMVARVGRRLVRGKVTEWLRKEQWYIAYSQRQSAPGEEDVPDGAIHRFKELLPPPDRYWADPFPAFHDGRHFIFIEEYFYSSPNAQISVIEFDEKGLPGFPRPILKRDYHLSYPFVFNWQGEWYMVPETLDRNAVELFKATRFPDEWTFVGEMLRGIAATDATLAEIEGRWWLFTAVRLFGAEEATGLFLFHSASPLGPWTSHFHNPVKIDVCGARPAGRLFSHNDILYRPGQAGAPRYGAATIIHRVDEISPTRFHETPVSTISPTWRPGLLGTHTLNTAVGLTAIDALRSIPRFV